MAIDAPVHGRTETEQEPPTGSTWSALRPLLLRIHFYAGLLIAPLLLAAAASGLLYALSFQAEKVIYSHELEVPVGDRALPLSAQVEAARDARPDGTVTGVWPSSEDGATTRVLMDAPGVEEGKSLAVFVDPYTAQVRGELPSYGSSGALPLRSWIDSLHRDLLLGDFGRHYSELAASWLWVVALGGLLLWLGRRRSSKRALFVPERGTKGRRRTLSWHGTVGLWAVIGLVLLSATGLTWSRYAGENIGAVQDQLGGATPAVSAAVEPGAAAGGEHAGHGDGAGAAHQGADVGVDQALRSAQAAGIDGRLAITMPAEGTGYVVKETDTVFPVHLDSVAVDPANGEVIDELRFADYPVLAKLTRFGIDAHMGVFLGLANQLALAALALALILLILWGYRMWWLRRPTKGRTLAGGRPIPRGAWRKAPVTALLPLAAATALVGWFVPLLGISLLAFVLVDAAVGAVRKVRART
ncbi:MULTISPECIES: PepSY-associated TM helix domain-containing protein [unclassified Streptomyces]|uniref:PepSY-associated TM helix domain-containing protein n=1 Tax=unclassified Streptomyces TaxID=2593676 RepID=UPI0028C48FDE|nr:MULTISPECIES: PepSY domain-containing protein [unclassified Streptomyces]WNO74975.1 PepSY domain-containing protein [Streptomyces sp. AM8-1-1]